MSDSASAADAAASTPGAPASGTTGAPPPTKRVPFWDNARFACIVLVVLGHAVQRLTYDSDIALGLYLLIYAFHMPAFAIISGYFSKGGAPTRRQLARVVTDILLPYLIFESLWALTKFLVETEWDANLSQPSWTLWFLLALATFRLILPYLSLLRWPLVWTVLISIGAGYLPNIDSTFSLARTLGLLPFFTLGWWLSEHDIVARFRLLRRPWWVSAASAALFAGAGWLAWAGTEVWVDVDLRRWIFWDESYLDIVGAQWWAGAVRLAVMALALALSASFFALIPLGSHRWTHLGQYTMYVYLLHSFVLYPIRESGALRGLDPTWLWLPIVVAASVLIAAGLASKPVRTLFRPLVEPRPAWIFVDPGLAGGAGRRSDPTGSRRQREAPRSQPDPRQNGRPRGDRPG